METPVSFEKQYKNIIRKFFFRQNPPKPLTREEFMMENHLERKSQEEINNRYYSYLYVYNYQYVKALDEKVNREIGEASLEDEELAQIEKFLANGNHFESKGERRNKNKNTKFSKKEKKHSKKHSFSLKEKLSHVKECFVEKESNLSHLMLLIVCGLITLGSVGFGVYNLGCTLLDLIFQGIGSSLKSLAISGMAFMIGAISWTTQSIVRNKNYDDYDDQDMIESEEEFGEFFQPKKHSIKSKGKEKEEVSQSNEVKDFENDTLSTIPMKNSNTYKMSRTNSSAIPFFEKKPKKAKNSLMVNTKSFFNKMVDSLKLDDDPYEDEEELYMEETPTEKTKVKVR